MSIHMILAIFILIGWIIWIIYMLNSVFLKGFTDFLLYIILLFSIVHNLSSKVKYFYILNWLCMNISYIITRHVGENIEGVGMNVMIKKAFKRFWMNGDLSLHKEPKFWTIYYAYLNMWCGPKSRRSFETRKGIIV